VQSVRRLRRIEEDGTSKLISAGRNQAAAVQFDVIRLEIDAGSVQEATAAKERCVAHKQRTGTADVDSAAIILRIQRSDVLEESIGDDDSWWVTMFSEDSGKVQR
jgi:hypothetical protein